MSRTRASGTLLPAAVLFCAALALHAIAWLQYRGDPFATTYVADALSYHEWAERIAARGLATEPVFHQAPLFPWLLSRLYAATAAPLHGTGSALLQALLNSAAIALVVPLGRAYLGSTAAGVVGGLLMLLHGPLIFYGLKLLPVPLALCTQAIALLSLARARRGGRGAAAASGLAWGVAAIARAEVLLLLPLPVFALLAAGATKRSGRWVRVAAFLGGLVAALAPVAWHNGRHGDLVVVAASGGENLFIGNQRGGNGGHRPLHPQAGDLFTQRELAARLAEEAAGRPLLPSAVSRYWGGRAVDEVREDPGAWLLLELRKLGRVLHPGDPTDIYSFALERSRYLPVLWLAAVGPWLLIGLALAGLRLAWRRAREQVWPLAVFCGLQLLVLLLFFVDNRLRLPLLYASAPLAGHAVVRAFRSWREQRRRAPLAALIVFATLATAVGSAALVPSARDVVRLAAVLSTQQRLDEALSVLEPVVSSARPDAYALDQAGWVLEKKGDLPAARERYRAALRGGLNPARALQVRTRLAGVHERLGELGAAEQELDAAVTSSGAGAIAYFERGMFHLRRGAREAARRDLVEAARRDPRWAAPRQALSALGAGAE